MLATLILGIVAGAGAPYAEDRVKKFLDSVLPPENPISDTELRMFTFAICLVGAAIVASIFAFGSALALSVGGAIGVFGPRILNRIQKRQPPDYGDDV